MAVTKEPKRQVHVWRGFGHPEHLDLQALTMDYECPACNGFNWLHQNDAAVLEKAQELALLREDQVHERHPSSELPPMQGVWSVIVTSLTPDGVTSRLRWVEGPLWED